MDFSASAATKDAARTWRRRSCTPPRFSSTLPEKNHPVQAGFLDRPYEAVCVRVGVSRALPIAGTPTVVEIKSKDDFPKYHGKLKGLIVMDGRPSDSDIGFKPEARRHTDESLHKREAAIDPAPESPEAEPGGEPKSHWDEEEEFDEYLAKAAERWRFFETEGVTAVVSPSSIRKDVRVDGFYDKRWHPTYPEFVISREHYGRIVRMLDRKVRVELSLGLAAAITDNVEGFNVVAEIPGNDLASEIVMLGGHFDSWHSGTGATDKGAGFGGRARSGPHPESDRREAA